LVPLNAANLKPADGCPEDWVAATEEVPVFTEGQLVKVADDEGVRDVLVGDRLLAFGVSWILQLLDSVSNVDDGVRVGDGLRPGIGGLEVQPLRKAALDAGYKCVIRGMADVLKAAIGRYKAVLREGP